MKRTLGITILISAMIFALAHTNSQPVGAAAKPIPGGANQLKGVSGGLTATLFNGKVRIRRMTLRAATAAEFPPTSGQTGVMFSFLASNGTGKQRAGYFSASIVDADGVDVAGHPPHIYDAYYSLQPGAAAHATLSFIVPAAFKAVKILLTDEGSPAGPAFRINLKAADLPAAQ